MNSTMNTDKLYAQRLASEYAPKDTSRLAALRKLDSRAKLPAVVTAYSLGIVSSLIFGTGMCLSMGVLGGGTAWLLLLLTLPMGAMILLLVRQGVPRPWADWLLCLSAAYSFYAVIRPLPGLFHRGERDPILLAAGALDLVAALMSILCLQTILISRFSSGGGGLSPPHGPGHRRLRPHRRPAAGPGAPAPLSPHGERKTTHAKFRQQVLPHRGADGPGPAAPAGAQGLRLHHREGALPGGRGQPLHLLPPL